MKVVRVSQYALFGTLLVFVVVLILVQAEMGAEKEKWGQSRGLHPVGETRE
jgi:hypothetical protein